MGERSDTTVIVTAAGKPDCNMGNNSRTLSTVSITLPPGCKFNTNNTAGCPWDTPSVRRSCTESSTCATSCNRKACPFT